MAVVLVVDDEAIILKIVRATLEKAGHSTINCRDGRDALEILNRELVDMVITDANMPGGISGFSLAATIRKNEKLKHLPIMFLTGRRDKADVARAMQAGVDDYLVKPIDEPIFLAKVEALLLAKRGPHSFTQTPVNAKASWSTPLQITSLSEQGISFISPINFPHDAKIKIESELFEELGFESPLLRVISTNRHSVKENTYMINVSFVGLTETEHQKIRRWVMSHNIKGQAS